MLKFPLLFLVLWLVMPCISFSQDPFFTHFYGNEAQFNPALVGHRGALSINLKAKQQWHSSQTAGYKTYLISLEESMPCNFFDYGLSVMQDTEGEGFLRTQQFGGQLAAPLRLTPSGNILQLRIGIGLYWGQQYVDFSQFLFIDQLDPKYGLTDANGQSIPTAFAPDTDGRSNWYFKPSGGIALQYVIHPERKKSININAGAAVHNLVPLDGARQQGQSWSLLGLGTPTVPRYTFFLNGEGIISYLGRQYVSVRPQLFLQTQRGLSYLEMGGDFSFSRQFSAGFYLHASQGIDAQASTNWGSTQLEVGFFPNESSRIDLGFGYAFNFSGLRNHIGNIFELTVRFSFATSPLCSLGGRPAPYQQNSALPCPNLRASSRNKIYENIWYNNNK